MFGGYQLPFFSRKPYRLKGVSNVSDVVESKILFTNLTELDWTVPQVKPVKPSCRVSATAVTLKGGYTEAVFEHGRKLQLRSLRNLISKARRGFV